MDMDDEISVDELKQLLDDGADVQLVDIRSPTAFERGHIPGSENIPFAELPNRVEELDGADRVVTICPMGESSVQAARLIRSYEGISGPVASLAEGLRGWEDDLEEGDGAGGETETGTDAAADASAEADGGTAGSDAPF